MHVLVMDNYTLAAIEHRRIDQAEQPFKPEGKQPYVSPSPDPDRLFSNVGNEAGGLRVLISA